MYIITLIYGKNAVREELRYNFVDFLSTRI